MNRVIAQYEVDCGKYSRPAVGTTDYQLSNIMPSKEEVGLAGYNQEGKLMTPGKAADLSKQQFLVAEATNLDPNVRAAMQQVTSVPQQNFFNNQQPSNYLPVNYNMPDNLAFPSQQEKK